VVPDPENYTLTLDEDGSFSAKADCNQASGTYEATADALTLTLGAVTRKACPPGSLGDQYLGLLPQAASFRVQGSQLELGLVDEQGEGAGVMVLEDAAVAAGD
jgi:heat shock protein HslJ